MGEYRLLMRRKVTGKRAVVVTEKSNLGFTVTAVAFDSVGLALNQLWRSS